MTLDETRNKSEFNCKRLKRLFEWQYNNWVNRTNNCPEQITFCKIYESLLEDTIHMATVTDEDEWSTYMRRFGWDMRQLDDICYGWHGV